jgi:hypothetical protein
MPPKVKKIEKISYPEKIKAKKIVNGDVKNNIAALFFAPCSNIEILFNNKPHKIVTTKINNLYHAKKIKYSKLEIVEMG